MRVPTTWIILIAALAVVGSGFIVLSTNPLDDELFEPQHDDGKSNSLGMKLDDTSQDEVLRVEVTHTEPLLHSFDPDFFPTVNASYEEWLMDFWISHEGNSWKENRNKLEISIIWLDDQITGEAFNLTYMQDFDGSVPDFLLLAAHRSNSLEIPDSWKPSDLRNAVLIPAEKLAASLGHELEISEEGKLHGLSLDLLNHQRRYISDYSKVLNKQSLRKSVVEEEAKVRNLPQDALTSLLELDPVFIDLTQQLEAMDSTYIKEFMRLLP